MELTGLEPLEGGWSGETFVGSVAGERSVVRVYRPGSRSEQAPEIDAALLRLVRGLLPVPEVLEVRRGSDQDPGVLVTSFLPGVRGDLLLPALDDDALARVGARLGRVAADLAGMPMLRHGEFVDGDLRIRDFGLGDLSDHLERLLPDLGHLTPREVDGLREVCDLAQDRLDAVSRTCLVHSDLNPKNLLLDPDTLALTAVLDWEFAHAGTPFTDLGNLLRFEREPAYVEAVLAAYGQRHGTPPAEALDLARSADLWALLDLATRRGQNPVTTRADGRVRAIAGARDVHAS